MKRVPTKQDLYWFERDYQFKYNWNAVDRFYRGSTRKHYHIDWLVPTLCQNGVLNHYKVSRYRDHNSIRLQSFDKYKGKNVRIFIYRSSKQCYRIMLEHNKGLMYGSAQTADKVSDWIKQHTPRRIKAKVYVRKKYRYAKNVKRRLGV